MNDKFITRVVEEAKKLLNNNPEMKYKQAIDKAKETVKRGHA